MTNLETALYLVVKAAIDAAEEGDALFGVELLKTVYEPATTRRAIRIGDSNADYSPLSGGQIEEFDVIGNLEILSQPEDDSGDAFVAVREDARALALSVAQLVFDDVTLGDRVQDSRILGGVSGWGNLRAQVHRIVRLHVIANETGAYRRE
jgi:hypothetical protein